MQTTKNSVSQENSQVSCEKLSPRVQVSCRYFSENSGSKRIIPRETVFCAVPYLMSLYNMYTKFSQSPGNTLSEVSSLLYTAYMCNSVCGLPDFALSMLCEKNDCRVHSTEMSQQYNLSQTDELTTSDWAVSKSSVTFIKYLVNTQW